MTRPIVLCPRDGLSLKDSRSFGLAGGVAAGGLAWPTPTTVAGAARATVGLCSGLSMTYGEDAERWLAIREQVSVRGPLPMIRELGGGGRWEPLWPAARDCLRLPHQRAGHHGAPASRLVWLEPRARAQQRAQVMATWSNDSEHQATEALMLPCISDPDKPLEARRLWTHTAMRAWLAAPGSRDEPRAAPEPELRIDTRLAIDPASQAAMDGFLFQLPTYEMLLSPEGARTTYEIGVGLLVDGVEDGEALLARPWRVGGESRAAWPEALNPSDLDAPDDLTDDLVPSRRLRLVLVTPARFATGWRPDWLHPEPTPAGFRLRGELPVVRHRVELRAAFVERPQWLSGWDLVARRPKPSFACVAAGAVYYVESLDRPFDAEDVRALWLSSIQNHADDAARDGFGLVLPGVWPTDR